MKIHYQCAPIYVPVFILPFFHVLFKVKSANSELFPLPTSDKMCTLSLTVDLITLTQPPILPAGTI